MHRETRAENLPHRRRRRLRDPYLDLGRWPESSGQFFEEGQYEVETGEFDFAPNCDFYETTDNYVLQLDIPGVAKEDLNVELEEGLLSVSGKRKEIKRERLHIGECLYGSFKRSVSVPNNADTENMSANYKDGVLEVKLSKKRPGNRKEIPVH